MTERTARVCIGLGLIAGVVAAAVTDNHGTGAFLAVLLVLTLAD